MEFLKLFNMRTVVQSLIMAVLSLLLPSCIFMGPSVKGDGNVREETREVGEFHGISVTSGMNVHLIQGNQRKVVVVADANLHKLIETKVEDGILEVRALANIWHAGEKKVVITISEIDEISGTAGSNIYTDNQLVAGKITIKGSAGSNLHIDIDGQNVTVSASSGSNMNMKGTIREFFIKTSSGANIKAGDVQSSKCEAHASSGGNLWISVQNELTANASSGGNIFYSGTPATFNPSSSSGGNIIKQ
jgi:hypothetical protein